MDRPSHLPSSPTPVSRCSASRNGTSKPAPPPYVCFVCLFPTRPPGNRHSTPPSSRTPYLLSWQEPPKLSFPAAQATDFPQTWTDALIPSFKTSSPAP